MRTLLLLVSLAIVLSPAIVNAEVLGPCGTEDAKKPAAAISAPAAAVVGQPVQRLLLPGEKAPNFELSAIVGKDIKKIKLSDYDGKWRVVCFYPADFTFV